MIPRIDRKWARFFLDTHDHAVALRALPMALASPELVEPHTRLKLLLMAAASEASTMGVDVTTFVTYAVEAVAMARAAIDARAMAQQIADAPEATDAV